MRGFEPPGDFIRRVFILRSARTISGSIKVRMYAPRRDRKSFLQSGARDEGTKGADMLEMKATHLETVPLRRVSKEVEMFSARKFVTSRRTFPEEFQLFLRAGQRSQIVQKRLWPNYRDSG